MCSIVALANTRGRCVDCGDPGMQVARWWTTMAVFHGRVRHDGAPRVGDRADGMRSFPEVIRCSAWPSCDSLVLQDCLLDLNFNSQAFAKAQCCTSVVGRSDGVASVGSSRSGQISCSTTWPTHAEDDFVTSNSTVRTRARRSCDRRSADLLGQVSEVGVAPVSQAGLKLCDRFCLLKQNKQKLGPPYLHPHDLQMSMAHKRQELRRRGLELCDRGRIVLLCLSRVRRPRCSS